MVRDLFKKNIGMNTEFRYRGAEPGRLENFSDAVFALAITLLLISTTPPSTFEQIIKFTFDLLPFMMCITLIILIWHGHFVFYYRYGLRDNKVIVLNTLFLIIMLFYVYPLKFLTKLSLFAIAIPFKIDWLKNDLRAMLHGGQMGDLMIIYGIGAASVFFVLMLLYRYALSKSEALELNEIEIFDTKVSMRTNFLLGIIPLISVVIALIFYKARYVGAYSGYAYFFYGPVMAWHGHRVEKQRKALLLREEEIETNSLEENNSNEKDEN
jgi:uncharacterized membrane protein